MKFDNAAKLLLARTWLDLPISIAATAVFVSLQLIVSIPGDSDKVSTSVNGYS